MTSRQYSQQVTLILDLLFNLKVFADRRERDQFWTPALIVLLAAASNVVSAIASVMWLAPALSGPSIELYLVSAVTAILLPLTVWIGTGVACYVIATLSFLDIDLRETIWLTGVGMIPYVLSSLLGTAVTLFALTRVPTPASVQLAQARTSLIQSLVIVQFVNLLHVIAVLWTGMNWIEMGAAVWGVSKKQAAKIVFVPLALLLVIFTKLKILN